MKTLTLTVYSFEELSQSAKENAIQNYLSQGVDYAWNEENVESFREFCSVFNLKLINYSVGTCGHSYAIISFNQDNDVLELSGVRLLKYLWNNYRNDIYGGKYYSVKSEKPIRHNRVKSETLSNGKTHNAYRSAIQLESCCPFTGYCMDDSILKPVFDFMAKPCKHTTFEDLMNECKEAWISAWVSDMEYQESDEYISEHLEANEYEFDEDGNLI